MKHKALAVALGKTVLATGVNGWKLAEDPTSGDKYYYNKERNITQWEPPIEEMLALLDQLED